MKFPFLAAALLATSGSAMPIEPVHGVAPGPALQPLHPVVIDPRGASTDVENELEDGPCRDITFIFARGSAEIGNMGVLVGPQTCDALKSHYGSDRVACQGVGGAYIADLAGNFVEPYGTYPAAIQEAQKLFNLANSKCPDSTVVACGYSQGAAVMSGALPTLQDNVKSQVVGTVLYGDTRFQQDGGRIPNYPVDETRIFCAPGDEVCDGTLIVTAAHLTYAAYVPQAEAFFQERIGTKRGD